MNKNNFIALPLIQDFLLFLERACLDNGFEHSWVSYDRKSTNIAKGELWRCSSVIDAAYRYYWPATCPFSGEKLQNLEQTEVVLNKLQQQLDKALIANDAQLCRDVCIRILKWGGVDRYSKVAPFVREPSFDITGYLSAVRTALTAPELDSQSVQLPAPFEFQLDSGSTKIYALLVSGFVIYDSRVGCALALLAGKFWETQNSDLRQLPEQLRFLWSGNRDSRNPNPDGFNLFKTFSSKNYKLRVAQNIETSWLLQELAARLKNSAQFGECTLAELIRFIEAGLFMVGYGTSRMRKAKKVKSAGNSPAVSKPDHGLVSNYSALEHAISAHERQHRPKSKTAVIRFFYDELSQLKPRDRTLVLMNGLGFTKNSASTCWFNAKQSFKNNQS